MSLPQHERGIHVVCARKVAPRSPYHPPQQPAEGAEASEIRPRVPAHDQPARAAPVPERHERGIHAVRASGRLRLRVSSGRYVNDEGRTAARPSADLSALRRDACPSRRPGCAPGQCSCRPGERRGEVPGDGPGAAGVPGRRPLSRAPGRVSRARAPCPGRPGPAAMAPVPTADRRAPAAVRPPSGPVSCPRHAWAGTQRARAAPRRPRARRPAATYRAPAGAAPEGWALAVAVSRRFGGRPDHDADEHPQQHSQRDHEPEQDLAVHGRMAHRRLLAYWASLLDLTPTVTATPDVSAETPCAPFHKPLPRKRPLTRRRKRRAGLARVRTRSMPRARVSRRAVGVSPDG